MAPNNVHIGADDRIGATMEIGRYFMAKNEKIHDESTMILLMNMRNCVCAPENGTKKIESCNVSGESAEIAIKGIKKQSDVAEEMSITSNTTLPLTDIFLNISYMPKNMAEQMMIGIHILFLFFQRQR